MNPLIILDQEKSEDVEQLLYSHPIDSFYLTEFALYSICLVLIRHKMHNVLTRLTDDLPAEGGVHLVRLDLPEIKEVSKAAQRFDLDFYDDYQYIAAEKYNLTIISFDADFDRTELGRKTPAEVPGI